MMTTQRAIPIEDEPAYRAAEVARIVGVPASTVTAWAFGQGQRGARFQPVLSPADRKQRLLSFANLCELHVLATIRRVHRISLPNVRRSLKYVSAELQYDHPLIAQQFFTNGADLFVQHAGGLLNVSQQGQQALRGGFALALDRIEWTRQGSPLRLFPFARKSLPRADLPKAVAVDPRIAFGRPILLSAGVRTDVIADRFDAGDSPEELAEDYGVARQDIWEALRFERAHLAA